MADAEVRSCSKLSRSSENLQTSSDHSECSFADAVETKDPDQVADDAAEPDCSPLAPPLTPPENEKTKASIEETLLERFLNSTPPLLSCEDVEGGYEGTADVFEGAGDNYLDFDKGEDTRNDEYNESDNEDEDCVEEERQQGDGQESVGPADTTDKVLDFDEDKRNPQYIPKKGAFYEHDDRAVGGDEDTPGTDQAANEDEKDGRRKKKLWHDEGVWGHDMFREEEQAPKTKEELINTYGYDIRTEEMAPRARRRRRYSRGPNKYTRSWQDEDAYAAKGSSSFHGGRRGRGRHPPSFEEEDFPKLPVNSSAAEMQKETAGEAVKTLTFENSYYGGEEQDKKEVGEHVPVQRQGNGEWRSSKKSNAVQQRESRLVRHQPRRPPHAAGDDEWASPEQPKDTDTLRDSEGVRRGQRYGDTPPRPSGIGRGRGRRRPGGSAEEAELLRKGMLKLSVKAEDMVGSGDSPAMDAGAREEHCQQRGAGDLSSRPKRYSSLRQRPSSEVASSFAPRSAQFYDASYQQQPQQPPQYSESAPAPVSSAGSRQTSVANQPPLLPPGHFPAYAAYPEGFILPPSQPPVLSAAQPPVLAPTQPPVLPPAPAPVMAPNQAPVIPGSFLPPAGIVGFTAQYATYPFPPQYNATTPPAPPPQTTPPQRVCHGGITYYNTQSQQHQQRSTPLRRPTAAIPILPPPTSEQQDEDKETLITSVEKAQEHYDIAPTEVSNQTPATPVES